MNTEIRVWDPLVRVFHWSLALFFFISYLSGEDESSLHVYSGYVVLGLISFRLVWGLIGTHYARFSQFVTGPGAVADYLKSLMSGQPQHYTGHNPAGGWMVIALIISLFITGLSGLQLYAVEEGKGPFAQSLPTIELIAPAYADSDRDDDEHEGREGHGNEADEEFWEEIHEAAANFTLFLVFLHIAGVIVSSMLHGENLVRAMITGRKQPPAE